MLLLGKVGHKSPKCQHAKDMKGEDWAINKSQSHAQQKSKTPSVVGPPSSVTAGSKLRPEPQVGWAGVHCAFAQASNLSDMILLDSDSTDSVFVIRSMLQTNIRDSKDTLKILTNGGTLKTTQKCDVPDLRKCCFNKDSITNIIAMRDMRKKFCVTMDTKKEVAIIVHKPNKAIKFKEWPNGLYAMNP
jgi:hypothetical protein